MGRVIRRSFLKPGRLVPTSAEHLRGRSVKLSPGHAVAWHSTGDREEILIALGGRLWLEIQDGAGARKTTLLSAGRCAFIPTATQHRVLNRSRRRAHYLYVTAGSTPRS